MTTAETRAGALPDLADVPARDLRVAVLGVGMMGADHVARLHSRISGAQVVAVSDAFAEKAEQVAATVPGCRVIGDPLAAITDDDVDAVLVATPGQFHEEQVLACIERGIPVLCEKPLTMEAESSLALVRAEDAYAARTGRRYSVEYALIRDVNDQPWRADLLGKRLHGALGPLVHVNLIPLNPTPGSEWDASPKAAEREFVKRVRERGVSCTVRDTRGREIAAACGQLAAEG